MAVIVLANAGNALNPEGLEGTISVLRTTQVYGALSLDDRQRRAVTR
jgi:hypothetical protein